MKHFQPLSIPNNWFNKESLLTDIGDIDPNRLQMWKKWDTRPTIFDGTINEWLSDLGCYAFFAEVFYTPPKKNLVWHIDTEAPSNFIKINFVWGSDNHLMQWGKVVHNRPLETDLTTAGTRYLEFKEYEVKVIDSYKICTPTIVNIGVPHRVINMSNEARWCLSVNIHDSNTGSRLTIDEACDRFSEYVLN